MNKEKKSLLFVVPYNPILGSRGPQGPKNVSQPLIALVSTMHDVVLIVVSEDATLTENALRVVFPTLQHVHIVRPLIGWARLLARLRFILLWLPPALADGLSHELPTLLRKYAACSDLVHFEYFTLAPMIKTTQSICPVQLHCHDAYSLHQKRLLNQADGMKDKFMALLRFLMFRNLERSLIAKARIALTVSPIDQKYLVHHGLKNVHYLPPALREIKIAIPSERQSLRVELLCIVPATYQHSQAIALREFFREKFPIIERQIGGNLPVTLLGKSAIRLQAELLSYVKVDAVEFVDEYFSFLSCRNWICFYPQRAGAGLHTKLRDIMTVQLPIVGYTEIMDAFSGTSGEHYFSCANDDQVVDAISALLSDPKLHLRIGRGGLRLLSEQFGPASVINTWEKLNNKVGHTDAQEELAVNGIDLPRLQECQLSMAVKVRQICIKHNIPYFLIAGSLLGAVRHGGFIPWDDDLDLGMLRQDYDRFIAVAQIELGEAYFVQTYATDQYMPFPYAKVRINGTVLREKSSQKCKWNPGIFIDIFPFDGVPDNRFLRFMHKWSLRAIGILLIVKCGFNLIDDRSSSIKKYIFSGIVIPASWLMPRRFLVNALNFLSRLFSVETTRLVMATGGSYGYKLETIPRNWIERSVSMMFCGIEFSCPLFWEKYLANLYGNYMTLPPVESRYNRHNIVKLKFLDEL